MKLCFVSRFEIILSFNKFDEIKESPRKSKFINALKDTFNDIFDDKDSSM